MHLRRACLGEIPIEEFVPEGKTVRWVAGGTGADLEDLGRVRPLERKSGLENLGIRAGLRAMMNNGRCRIIQPHLFTRQEVGDLMPSVGKE